MDKALIAPDILSESRKRINQWVVARATAYIAAFSHYTISVIRVAKVVSGWYRRQPQEATWRFLADIAKTEILPVDYQVQDLRNASRCRGNHSWIAPTKHYIWIICVSPEVAELAGRICPDLEHTGQPIGIADGLIAATANPMISGLSAWDIASRWISGALRSIGAGGRDRTDPIKAFGRKQRKRNNI